MAQHHQLALRLHQEALRQHLVLSRLFQLLVISRRLELQLTLSLLLLGLMLALQRKDKLSLEQVPQLMLELLALRVILTILKPS